MFAAMLGVHIPLPASVSGAQWDSGTRVSFTAPGGVVTVRVQVESSPGSGSWSDTLSATVGPTTTDVDVTGYVQNASYRVRFERQGSASAWVAFATPDPFVGFPAAPAAVNFTDNGFACSGSVTPSETFCTVRYQFLDSGSVVLSEGTTTSDGVPSVLGGFVYPSSLPGGSFRARHERFSGTGPWASAWVSDNTP